MAPSVTPARSNSWTAWRSSILSILRGPPDVGTGPYLEAGTYLRMPGGRTEFREKSGQNLENQQLARYSTRESGRQTLSSKPDLYRRRSVFSGVCECRGVRNSNIRVQRDPSRA